MKYRLLALLLAAFPGWKVLSRKYGKPLLVGEQGFPGVRNQVQKMYSHF
jgi:hypothetical protein